MGRGLFLGALAGFGRGLYETNKMVAEQQQWDERMQKQQDFQLQRDEAQRVGLRQLERDRAALADELRQRRSAAINEAAKARGGDNRALAEEAARYDGHFGHLYGMDLQDRQLARQKERDAKADEHTAFGERMAERSYGLQAGAAGRAAESAAIQNEAGRLALEESKTLQTAKSKFRSLMEAGDEAGAMRVAKTFNLAQPGAQIGRYQFRSEEDEQGRKVTAIFDSTTGQRVGDSRATAPGNSKATDSIDWSKYRK